MLLLSGADGSGRGAPVRRGDKLLGVLCHVNDFEHVITVVSLIRGVTSELAELGMSIGEKASSDSNPRGAWGAETLTSGVPGVAPRVSTERVTGIKPALPAWESNGNRLSAVLTCACGSPRVTPIDPCSPWLVAR